MTQEITITNVGDHHEMAFDGGNSYPVPTNAIDKLDDDLTPEEEGESVTFVGDYGGHKHAKTFDVEEVIDGLGDENDGEVDGAPVADVPPEVPYNAQTAGVAQQINAQQLFNPTPDNEPASDDATFDFVCPNCGADANESAEKPYCSDECAHEDLADVEVGPR